MPGKKITYPKALRDIPRWRQRQLAEDILWFSRYSPVERLNHIDREWKEVQEYIEKFDLRKHETPKRSRPS